MLSPPMMTHNDFDFYEDLIRPLMQFLVQSNILKQANFDHSDGSDCSEEDPVSKFPDLKKPKQAEQRSTYIQVSYKFNS